MKGGVVRLQRINASTAASTAFIYFRLRALRDYLIDHTVNQDKGVGIIETSSEGETIGCMILGFQVCGCCSNDVQSTNLPYAGYSLLMGILMVVKGVRLRRKNSLMAFECCRCIGEPSAKLLQP